MALWRQLILLVLAFSPVTLLICSYNISISFFFSLCDRVLDVAVHGSVGLLECTECASASGVCACSCKYSIGAPRAAGVKPNV